jgi:hypothetical protein
MTSFPSFPPAAPEPLLAVACPTCFGALAVGAELFGRAADCPLCGHGFQVPANAAPAPAPSSPIASSPIASSAVASSAVAGTTTPAADRGASGTSAAPSVANPAAVAALAPATTAGDSRAGSGQSSGETPGSGDPAAGVADGSAVAAAETAALRFREPVVTVGSGENVIELRRLTPEEKAQRRARRTIVMLLTGVSILLAIVLTLGRSRR